MSTQDILLKVYDYIKPFIDVGLIAFILYKVYQIIFLTKAAQLLKAAIIVGIFYALVVLLRLDTLMWIFSVIAPGLIIALAIVFQPELRLLLLKIAQAEWFAYGKRSRHTYVDSVLIAAEVLSKQKRGMLAVFLRKTNHDEQLKSGTRINADVSSNLLVTIFGHDTPLHDGACFIQNGKIIAAGCFLPLSNQYGIKKTFGTRHRAALGMSEAGDAITLVVSEETGAISLAYDGKLHYDLTLEQITKILESELSITAKEKNIEDTIDEHKENS